MPPLELLFKLPIYGIWFPWTADQVQNLLTQGYHFLTIPALAVVGLVFYRTVLSLAFNYWMSRSRKSFIEQEKDLGEYNFLVVAMLVKQNKKTRDFRYGLRVLALFAAAAIIFTVRSVFALEGAMVYGLALVTYAILLLGWLAVFEHMMYDLALRFILPEVILENENLSHSRSRLVNAESLTAFLENLQEVADSTKAQIIKDVVDKVVNSRA